MRAPIPPEEPGVLRPLPPLLLRTQGRHDDLLRRPLNVGTLPGVELAGAAVRDPLQAPYGEHGLGEVLVEQVVALQFDLDAVEHVGGMSLVAADQAHELPCAGQDRPEAGALGKDRLARCPGHCEREEAAAGHRLLDLANDLQVIVAPRQVERGWEVALAEGAEAGRRFITPVGVRHTGDVRDAAPLAGDTGGPVAGTLLHIVVGGRRETILRIVTLPEQPRDVTHQVDGGAVADAVARAVPLAVYLPGHDDLAERGRVQQAGQLRRFQAAGIKSRHRRPPPSGD